MAKMWPFFSQNRCFLALFGCFQGHAFSRENLFFGREPRTVANPVSAHLPAAPAPGRRFMAPLGGIGRDSPGRPGPSAWPWAVGHPHRRLGQKGASRGPCTDTLDTNQGHSAVRARSGAASAILAPARGVFLAQKNCRKPLRRR